MNAIHLPSNGTKIARRCISNPIGNFGAGSGEAFLLRALVLAVLEVLFHLVR
jgi:hypothetical protein